MERHLVDRRADRTRGRAGSPPFARPARPAALAAVLLAGSMLAGCAGSQSAVSSTVKPLTDAAGFSTKVDPPKDFVTATRPANIDYMPVGVTPPSRPQPIMKPADLAKATGDLEATRAAHDSLAGRKPADAKVKPKKQADPKKQGEKPAPSL